MKARIASIVLLCSLFAPFVLWRSALQYQKQSVRREVKHRVMAGIDRSELVLLKFTDKQMAEELEWEHSKEFEYREHMYDIVSREQIGDTTYLWCWPDDEETALNQRVDQLFISAFIHHPAKEGLADDMRLFLEHFHFPLPESSGQHASCGDSVRFAPWTSYYVCTHPDPDSPPPDSVA